MADLAAGLGWGEIDGGGVDDGRADVAGEADSGAGVGAGGGFLSVGPTVGIGVGGGVEGEVECAGVEFFLPEVADAVAVGVVDGLKVWGG